MSWASIPEDFSRVAGVTLTFDGLSRFGGGVEVGGCGLESEHPMVDYFEVSISTVNSID